jgi:beta-lactamase class A
VSPGTKVLLVSVDGRVVARRDLRRSRFDFTIQLPPRAVRLVVTAVGEDRGRAATPVDNVFGLPTKVARGPPRAGREDARLARTIRGLAQAFPGTCGIYIRDLRTGAGTSWNAGVAFPAASTLKVAIALEVMRVLRGKPARHTRIDRLLRSMLVPSDDKAANDVLAWLGGSISDGAARVNATLRALGLTDTEMYGGYIVQAERPSFVGKRTTASDFGRLLTYIHQAADGKGRLARRFRGSVVPGDARFLLYLLAHARPNWLGGLLPRGQVAVPHKPGWITRARHDGGVVYWRDGSFVAVVMTWNANGVGASSEALAARVARAALAHFRGAARRGSSAAAGSRAGRGKVLVVLRRRPATAPAPADRGERPNDHVSFHDHPSPPIRPVEEAASRGRRDAAAADVGVLDGVDVDRKAERML